MKELYGKITSELHETISALTGAFGKSSAAEEPAALLPMNDSDLTPADRAVTDRTRAWRRLLVGKALMALSKLANILSKLATAITANTPKQTTDGLLAAPATPAVNLAVSDPSRRR